MNWKEFCFACEYLDSHDTCNAPSCIRMAEGYMNNISDKSRYWRKVVADLDYLNNWIWGDFPALVPKGEKAPFSRCEYDNRKDFEEAVRRFHDTYDVILNVIQLCYKVAKNEYNKVSKEVLK